MANRYWLGGLWSSAANWSATNNGAGGASIPTNADSVLWHTVPTSATYTIDVNAFCLDFDFTGATNNPIVTSTVSFALALSGSLILIPAMTYSLLGGTNFNATATGKTVNTAGKTVNSPTFSGSGGGWTLQSSLTVSGTLTFGTGSLDTNNFAVNSTGSFSLNTGSVRSLTLGSSVITCASWIITSTTNLTFNAGTSTIIVTVAAFNGAGLTYNNVTFNASSTVTGSNTFNTLTIAAGKTISLTSLTTQTITLLICNGTTALPSTLKALTAASIATIILPVGRYLIRHTTVQDITITGATSVTSIAGTNVSGNTGITFVSKFEIGRIKNDGSFNWYSAATGASAKVSG